MKIKLSTLNYIAAGTELRAHVKQNIEPLGSRKGGISVHGGDEGLASVRRLDVACIHSLAEKGAAKLEPAVGAVEGELRALGVTIDV